MRMQLARVDQKQCGRAVFGAMTYPLEFPYSDEVFKSHLDSFGKRFLRAYPDAGFFWKLEFQKRGAPHFHIIAFRVAANPNELRVFQQWLARSWFDVVASGDRKHLAAGTSAELLRSQFAMMRYCGGYVSKDDQTLVGRTVGRYWGIVGRRNIPFGPAQETLLSRSQANLVRRTMRRSMMAANRTRRIKHLDLDKSPEHYLSGRIRLLRKSHPQLAMFKRCPRKMRLKNNQTINLFCDADAWSIVVRRLCSLAATAGGIAMPKSSPLAGPAMRTSPESKQAALILFNKRLGKWLSFRYHLRNERNTSTGPTLADRGSHQSAQKDHSTGVASLL
jgi:hypothetical protein